MQSDVARHRAEALQIFTITTIVVGFGLFENPPVVGPAWDRSAFWLAVIKLSLVPYTVLFYLQTMVSVGILLLRDSLAGRKLVRARRRVFVWMSFTILSVASLFLLRWFDENFVVRL